MTEIKNIFARTYCKTGGIYRPWKKENFNAFLGLGGPLIEEEPTGVGNPPPPSITTSPTSSLTESDGSPFLSLSRNRDFSEMDSNSESCSSFSDITNTYSGGTKAKPALAFKGSLGMYSVIMEEPHKPDEGKQMKHIPVKKSHRLGYQAFSVIGKGLKTKLMADSLRQVSGTSSINTDCLEITTDLESGPETSGTLTLDSVTESEVDGESKTDTSCSILVNDEDFSEIEVMRDAPIQPELYKKKLHLKTASVDKRLSLLHVQDEHAPSTAQGLAKSKSQGGSSKVIVRPSIASGRSVFSLSDEDMKSSSLADLYSKELQPVSIKDRRYSNILSTPKKHKIKRSSVLTFSPQRRNSKQVSFPTEHLKHEVEAKSALIQHFIAAPSGGILKRRKVSALLQPFTSTPQKSVGNRVKSRRNFFDLSFNVSAVPLPTYSDEDLVSVSSIRKDSNITAAKHCKSTYGSLSDEPKALFPSEDISEVSFPPKHSTPKCNLTKGNGDDTIIAKHLFNKLLLQSTPEKQLKRRSPGSGLPCKPNKKRQMQESLTQSFTIKIGNQAKRKQLQYTDKGIGPECGPGVELPEYSHGVKLPECSPRVKLPKISQSSYPSCVITVLEDPPIKPLEVGSQKFSDKDFSIKHPQDCLEILPDSIFI